MLDDLKFVFRRFRNSPGFAIASVMTLTLAIGVNTAIFSIADAILFRPLPYSDPDRLYVLEMLNRQTGSRFTQIPYQYLQAIKENHRGIEEVAMSENGPSLIVTTNGESRRVSTMAVTANYLQTLGVRPARGRLFDSRDSTQPGNPAILSYATWQQQFGGDELIIGRPVTLGTMTFDIVGILPAGFTFPPSWTVVIESSRNPEIVTVMPPKAYGANDGIFYPTVRLKRGTTREQAQAEIEALVAPLATGNPQMAGVVPVLEDMKSVLYAAGRPMMGFLLAAAALVLLIGCANLAIMLLARGKRDEHEIGVRLALGASRGRIVRPIIIEAALISVAGALLAVLATDLTFNALLRLVPRVVYGNAPIGVGPRVMLFAFCLALLAGLSFSVLPAWRSSRLDAQTLILGRYQRIGGRRGRQRRFDRAMIAIQVALALPLVFGVAIACRAFLSVLSVPLGFTPDNIITLHIYPGGESGAERQAFYVRAIETMARHGDVGSVGAAGSLPLDSPVPNDGVPDAATGKLAAGIDHVLPGYFETIGIPLIRGRLLNWNDLPGGASASVISESAARRLFPGRDPLGAIFTNRRGRQFVVVGLVADVRKYLEREAEPPVYVIPGEATRHMFLVVRTRSRQEATLAAIRREIGALAPGNPVTAGWWTDSISALTAYRNPQFQTFVLGVFAAMALVLTAQGIFGVIAFSVAARTHEMGIRLALGAAPRSLVMLMMRQTLIPLAGGLLIGISMMLWVKQIVEAQLYRVETRDPVMLAIAILTIVAVAVIAAYLPARRASRVDPIVVLKAE
jgi:putative ABC transport system permease protein